MIARYDPKTNMTVRILRKKQFIIKDKILYTRGRNKQFINLYFFIEKMVFHIIIKNHDNNMKYEKAIMDFLSKNSDNITIDILDNYLKYLTDF